MSSASASCRPGRPTRRHPASVGLDRLLAEHEAGKADHGNRLWLLVNSEAWYRMRILGQSQAELAERIAATESWAPEVRKSA